MAAERGWAIHNGVNFWPKDQRILHLPGRVPFYCKQLLWQSAAPRLRPSSTTANARLTAALPRQVSGTAECLATGSGSSSSANSVGSTRIQDGGSPPRNAGACASDEHCLRSRGSQVRALPGAPLYPRVRLGGIADVLPYATDAVRRGSF